MKNSLYIRILIVYFIIIELTGDRYINILPTIHVYPNNRTEAQKVFEINKEIDDKMKDLFYKTDESVSKVFMEYTNHSEKELNKLIQSPMIIVILYFFKYVINRARPYQVNGKIIPLESKTGNTPSYPAGHAMQAYYLSYVLGKKEKSKSSTFKSLAEDCNSCRIAAGIHYPSDGEFSKTIITTMIKMNLI